jgi:hypothetical protein
MTDANGLSIVALAQTGDMPTLAWGWEAEPPEFCFANRHRRTSAIDGLAPEGLMGWLYRWLQKDAN